MDSEISNPESYKKYSSLTTGVSIHAGFPNPASDNRLQSLDFNQLLIEHTASTFTFRVAGNEWRALGVFDGDLAVVDRALDPRKNDIVVWWHEQETSFALSHTRDMPPDAATWGVVTAVIHQFRRQRRDDDRAY